ncbi:MAG: ABC transporter ATP-binding protein [Eubacteriales bacterium]|nr:ABC transporter ATP-binding protein [Eubacteriales bacterium]
MLLELTGIEKTFAARRGGASVKALCGVDLAVDRGEMIAIRGSSGAGKSTLLHIIGCLDRPTKGSYRLDGKDVVQESAARLAQIRNRTFGFVMQHFALVDEDSALQNAAIPLLFARTSPSLAKARALQQLDHLGIAHLARRKTATLSGGEKQRVAIARALVNHPDVILADEPTGALDGENSAMIMEIFKTLHAEGKTIIIVTHEENVAGACQRIITLSDGQIRAESPD